MKGYLRNNKISYNFLHLRQEKTCFFLIFETIIKKYTPILVNIYILKHADI